MPDLNEGAKLGIFDINGTLHTREDGVVSSVLTGFDNLHDLGIATTIITGRGLLRARSLLSQQHWPRIVSPGMPVSVENGSRLLDQDGRELVHRQLSEAEIKSVIGYLATLSHGIDGIAYDTRDSMAKSKVWLSPDGSQANYEKSNGSFAEYTFDSLTMFRDRIIDDQAGMLRIVADPEICIEVSGNLKSQGINAVLNQNEVNVLAEGVSKASGARDLADYVGVPLSDTMLAGDDFNDLEMLRLNGGTRLFVGSSIAERLLPASVLRIDSPEALGNYLAAATVARGASSL